MISKLLITIDEFPFDYLQKIFGEAINSMMEFLEENNLLNSNQLVPNESCEDQLLSIAHTYSSDDCYPSLQVRGLFLDIPRAFDRV